jgi:hypothetical protein
MLRNCFSPDYFAARARFRAAAQACDLSLASFPVVRATELAGMASDELLTIDVAIAGEAQAESALVISSGVHGVEGFFGSAVQLALLDALRTRQFSLANNTRLVLVHAINPFGFVKLRRWNEEGVDLNRNFLRPGEPFTGSPPLYSQIDPWLNPPSPPRRGLALPPRAVVDLARFGAAKLMQTIPVGQYDYPRGLFFGGREPAESTRIVQQHLGEWIGAARTITHLDFHTGLGKFGTHQLLLDVPGDHPQAEWFRRAFGDDVISALPAAVGDARETKVYSARGAFGHWCLSHFSERNYRFATAEFGTYPPLAVLLALRQENRAHHRSDNAQRFAWTKRRLVEMFAPAAARWRERVVADALALVRRYGSA